MPELVDKDKFIDLLHEQVGLCGHCGKRSCAGRKSHSTLPKIINTEVITSALDSATVKEPA